MLIEFIPRKLRLYVPIPEVSVSQSVTLMRDGNEIVAMLGHDLQEGIGGFGNTAADALRDLAEQMDFEKYRPTGIDF